MVNINNKGSVLVTMLVIIILISFLFIIIIYYDLDYDFIQTKYYGLPDYDFNDDSNVFIERITLNKFNYAFENFNEGEIFCVYGFQKNNRNILIKDLQEKNLNKCEEENLLGLLYISKNYNIYDIGCSLDENKIKKLDVEKNILSSVICNKNWIGFYNNNSMEKSFLYKIVN